MVFSQLHTTATVFSGDFLKEKFVIQKTWQEYAVDTVTHALATQKTEESHQSTLAALALINMEWERGHPSYYNTQFAVGSFLLPNRLHSLRVYAWRMVANGLGGYWQWQSHNGGVFSVAGALRHLGLLTEDEMIDTDQFNVRETHPGCHYFVVKHEFLARLVKKFELPTTNLAIGGKATLSEQEFRERESMKRKCFTGFIGSDGRPRYENALKIM